MPMAPRVLILDLEISPSLAAVWGIWNVNIPITNITGESEILSCAWKWHGEEECYYTSLRMAGHTDAGRKRMLKEIHAVLSEADVVVGYNTDRFDLKIMNQEFLLNGLDSPAPYKSIDLLKVVKKRFRWTSNKLDYVAQRLGIGKKEEHPGMSMWLTCMNKAIKNTEAYEEAWDNMEQYNVGDVFLTEDLYDKLLPWIPSHPNVNLYTEGSGCPVCGSTHIQSRGKQALKALVYKRYQCMGCSQWLRGSKPLPRDNAERMVQLS